MKTSVLQIFYVLKSHQNGQSKIMRVKHITLTYDWAVIPQSQRGVVLFAK